MLKRCSAARGSGENVIQGAGRVTPICSRHTRCRSAAAANACTLPSPPLHHPLPLLVGNLSDYAGALVGDRQKSAWMGPDPTVGDYLSPRAMSLLAVSLPHPFPLGLPPLPVLHFTPQLG